MPTEIYLVKVGMTMTEGIVSEWYIADGQQVKKGENEVQLMVSKRDAALSTPLVVDSVQLHVQYEG